MNSPRDDLKKCPLCNSDAFINHEVEHFGSHCRCSNDKCELSKIYIKFENWQIRDKKGGIDE